jgi:hypothetical protein
VFLHTEQKTSHHYKQGRHLKRIFSVNEVIKQQQKQTAFFLYLYTTRQLNSMIFINVKCCFGKLSVVLSDYGAGKKNSLLQQHPGCNYLRTRNRAPIAKLPAESANCMQHGLCFAIPPTDFKLKLKTEMTLKNLLTIRGSYKYQGLSSHTTVRPI